MIQTWTIRGLSKEIIKYPQQRTDCVVGVAGEEGTGKSVISRLEAKELYPPLLNKTIDLNECMFFGKKSLQKAMEETHNRIFIHDEAIANISRTFYDKDQIEFVKLMRMVRDHNHIAFFNLPVLWELDKILRNRVRIYIYVTRRVNLVTGLDGLALVFKKENNPFTTDPWNTKTNEKLFRMGKITRSKNFFGYLKIPYIDHDWFLKMEEEAKSIKDKKKIEAIEEDKNSKSGFSPTEVAKIIAPLIEDKLIKYGDMIKICNRLEVNYSSLKEAVYKVRRRDGDSAYKHLGGGKFPQLPEVKV